MDSKNIICECGHSAQHHRNGCSGYPMCKKYKGKTSRCLCERNHFDVIDEFSDKQDEINNISFWKCYCCEDTGIVRLPEGSLGFIHNGESCSLYYSCGFKNNKCDVL